MRRSRELTNLLLGHPFLDGKDAAYLVTATSGCNYHHPQGGGCD